MAENEDPPGGGENDDVFETIRRATLQGMKDYDRERDEWEAAVSEQERKRKESENDTPPGGKTDLGSFLLGGRRKTG